MNNVLIIGIEKLCYDLLILMEFYGIEKKMDRE